MDEIPDASSDDKQNLIDEALSKIRGATGTKRSFKMEIRLIPDVQERRKYESRLASFDQQLKGLSSDAKALESELQRNELNLQEGAGKQFSTEDAQKAGDQMLSEAHNLQDKTQDALSNTKQMIAESKEVGVATLEELERQRQVLTNIDQETDRIDDSLARAEKLLKTFGKRMAGDHFIQCFAVVNCLMLLGVLLYAIIGKKSLGGGDGDEPFDPAGGFLNRVRGTDTASDAGGEERLLQYLRGSP